jgi:hypothetical protein
MNGYEFPSLLSCIQPNGSNNISAVQHPGVKLVSYLSLKTFGRKLIEHFASSTVDTNSKVPIGVTHQQEPQNIVD